MDWWTALVAALVGGGGVKLIDVAYRAWRDKKQQDMQIVHASQDFIDNRHQRMITALQTTLDKVNLDLDNLRRNDTDQKVRIARLEEQIIALQGDNKQLIEDHKECLEENKSLKARIEVLEKRS